MNILEATQSYEKWMRGCTTVVETHLHHKHEQMKAEVFLFFRGTYYRWAQLWPEVCAQLRTAPKVLSSGDLHVNSFGTWRDSEGRLSWGVDDFDESYPLPYTNDLVRLAASLKIVNDEGDLTTKFKLGCDIILDGYRETLAKGGRPIVLAEHEANLQRLGIEAIKPPDGFWQKLLDRPAVHDGIPADAIKAMEKMFPDPRLHYKLVRREAGMGSLGQQRFVAIAECNGGCIAREAKALVPSASVWIANRVEAGNPLYAKAIQSAVRSPDPFQQIEGKWLIRRLSPDSNPVEIANLPAERDEERLLHAMGSEAANVHLGTSRQVKSILKDLRRRKANWLRVAAKDMAKTVEKEWKEYRKS
jgi:hypothetical protein